MHFKTGDLLGCCHWAISNWSTGIVALVTASSYWGLTQPNAVFQGYSELVYCELLLEILTESEMRCSPERRGVLGAQH